MPPPASEAHYQRQALLAATAAREAEKATDTVRLARSVAGLQYLAASGADTYLDTFDPDPAGTVHPLAFTGINGNGRPLLTVLQQAETQALLQVTAVTAVQDAGRMAVSAGITARRTLTGYVRMLTSPSCSRCAILAGKWFKWHQGFQRHPRCDCRHIPAAENVAGNLTTDPVAALRAGQVTGMSKANTRAILEDGANMGRIVNQYGVLASGQPRVLPGSKIMPEQLYRLAGDDRERSIELLKQAGYIT